MISNEVIKAFTKSVTNEIDNLTMKAIYGKLQRKLTTAELKERLSLVVVGKTYLFHLDNEPLIEIYYPEFTTNETHLNANVGYKVYE